MPEQAVLLVNLGSPASTSVPDVRRYLRAFLGDERVIDYPAWFRFLLLEGIILRVRPKKSAHAYSQVWTPEGAPLPVTTEKVRAKLETALGLPVLAGMRYEEPSITGALEKLRDLSVREVFLIPQYSHYAMSSWETVVVKVYEEARRVAPGLRFTTVQPFFADTDYIEALHTVSAPALAGDFDHLLISFHGVPVRHLRKADSSRELVRLAKSGVKKLLVMTPAFTADCLETLEDIAVEGKRAFLAAGGTEFRQIPCLNDSFVFIAFLAGRARAWLEPPRDAATLLLTADGTIQYASATVSQWWQVDPGALHGDSFPNLFVFEVVSSDPEWLETQ